jgi:hypothetical protein
MAAGARLWKLLDVKETTRMDERNNFVPVRIVRFMVGTHGPFQVQMDAKGFTAERMAAVLDKEAAEIQALEGPA